MHCQQANELFSDYIERRLDPAMTVSMENHMAACPSCREAMSSLRRVWTQLDRVPLVEPPLRLHASIMDALDTHLETEREKTAPRVGITGWSLRDLFRPRALAYGATALVLALSSVELVQSQRAALGPLGIVASLLHLQPTSIDAATLPPLVVTHSEWQINPAGGGTLVLSLKADTTKAAVLEPLVYHAELVPTSSAGAAKPITGNFDTSGFTTLRVPTSETLSDTRLRVALSFWTAQGHEVARQEIIVPVK